MSFNKTNILKLMNSMTCLIENYDYSTNKINNTQELRLLSIYTNVYAKQMIGKRYMITI